MREKLKALKARLQEMNAKNDELRQTLESRKEQSEQLAQKHREAEAALTSRLTSLQASNAAERVAFDADTAAIQRRRAELKDDYGDLYEMVTQLDKAIE